jgi:N6-adenosine-specific RNA methylase IME4
MKKPADDDGSGFRCVLADPPWQFKSNSIAKPGRNARRHYACLTVEQLSQLPLAERVAADATLFLCVPSPFLVIGAHIALTRAWGFRPTAMAFTWIKLRPHADPTNFTPADLSVGTGFTTRKSAEHIVLCRRGKSLRRDAGVSEIIFACRREHSRKPDELYARIERYCPGPRLDLFARESRLGWIAWGLEATRFDPPVGAP